MAPICYCNILIFLWFELNAQGCPRIWWLCPLTRESFLLWINGFYCGFKGFGHVETQQIILAHQKKQLCSKAFQKSGAFIYHAICINKKNSNKNDMTDWYTVCWSSLLIGCYLAISRSSVSIWPINSGA